jgi:GGDEF domain-containing protein
LDVTEGVTVDKNKQESTLEKKQRKEVEQLDADKKRAQAAQDGFTSRSWFYEMPLFYAFLVVLQRMIFPDDPGYQSVNPSPFWIGILLFGMRYGMIAGLVSGIVSSCLFALGVQQAGESFRLQDTDFYLQPGLFVILGASVGGAADKYAQRIGVLNVKIADLLERVSGLQRQIQAEQKVLRAVEQQVVSQMSSIVTLFHGSRELGTLNRSELLPAMLDFFTTALKASKTSLFVPKDGRWVLFDQRGWEEKDHYPKTLKDGHGVVGRAGKERRVVSLRDLFIAEGAGRLRPGARTDAIMAAPVVNPAGEPIAIFAVQSMDFIRFNSASVNLMTLLAEWGKESVEKCTHVEDLRSRSVLDEEFSIKSVRYFDDQLVQEFGRSDRFSLPFSILLVSPKLPANMSPDKKDALMRVVCRVLREIARTIDVVARTPYDFAPFGIVLTTTTRENAEKFKERLVGAFAKLKLDVPVAVGLGSFQHGMRNKEDIVAQAQADLS